MQREKSKYSNAQRRKYEPGTKTKNQRRIDGCFVTFCDHRKMCIRDRAKSGVSAAKLLRHMGAQIALYDRKSKENFAEHTEITELLQQGAVDFLGAEPEQAEARAEILILSPGVPVKQTFIQQAMQSGKKVISEIELGYEIAKAEFVGIGGTNGKTTTTALTGEIFKNSGRTTYVLGNICLLYTSRCV